MIQIPWRTGVNMREFAYYGTAARQYTSSGMQRQQLDQLQTMQVKLVRFYASFSQFSANQCTQKVLAALDLLQTYGMQAVICLTDSLSSEFTIAGDGEFHSGPLGHLAKHYWHGQAYQHNFMPFITHIAQACAQHPAVLMWELGNEFAIHPQPASLQDGQDFLAFAKLASEAIKAAAPKTLVSTGLVGSHHVAPQGYAEQFGRDLYSLPGIDAISIHYYADDGEKMNTLREMALAKALGKPFYVGEFGAPQDWPDRAGYYRAELEEWHQAGASTAMLWAFDSSPSDVGVSDTKAFASIRPGFEGIKAALREFGRPAEPIIIVPDKKEQPDEAKKMFTVVNGPVYVRRAPSLAPDAKIEGKWLIGGQQVEVAAQSCTVADGYIWWQHSAGWSAESSLDRQRIFMTEVLPVLPATKIFYVINGPVSWRDRPTLEPRTLIKGRGKVWRVGQRVEVNANSRTIADGYVWWQHSAGWSAERSLQTHEILMIEESQILDTTDLFIRLPLDLNMINWMHYYGNTTFAYTNGKTQKYDDYSQGLHGGIDFGHTGGAPVYAGIRADLNPTCTYVGNQRAFEPYRVDITAGEYLIIFGHLSSPDFSLTDRVVTPDTVLGYIDRGAKHVHIEIRRANKQIFNPLPFISDALQNEMFKRFPPTGMFQPNGGQWESPLDQPDIIIGGKVIGPRGS